MNTVITSREAIVEASLALAARGGMQAVSIRAVAAECGIAVGSVYHYFASKAELTSAAVEAIWRQILPPDDLGGSFPDRVGVLFSRVRAGTETYPDFLSVHAAGFRSGGQETGRRAMDRCLERTKAGLRRALEDDPQVRPGVFGPTLTEEDLVDFVFTALLSLLERGESSCRVLLELVRRFLY